MGKLTISDWSDGQIVPLTPVGRVTEYLLQFNQPQSVAAADARAA